jgi:hypothetical protein
LGNRTEQRATGRGGLSWTRGTSRRFRVQDERSPNCFCRRQTRDIAFLVLRGADHYAVPVSGLQLLNVTAIPRVMSNTSVELMASYLSPTQPLYEQTWLNVWAGDSPSCWLAMSTQTTWTGIKIWPEPLARSCEIVPTKTLALSMGRISLPRFLIKPMGPRRPYYRRGEGFSPTGVSDCLSCTQLASLACPEGHHASNILLNPLSRPDLTRIDWAAFRACLADRFPLNIAVHEDGSRQLRRGQRHLRGHSSMFSQASITWKSEASR